MNKLAMFILVGLGVLVLGIVGFSLPQREALAQSGEPPGATTAEGFLEIGQVRMNSAHFALNWNVAASGGNTMNAAHFRLSSTAGQPAIGNSSTAHFAYRAGYWQKFIHKIFLPIVLRNS